jgi:predicted nucleotidyltransferase
LITDVEAFDNDQLAVWAAAVPDVDKTVAPITNDLKGAVEILRQKFGPVRLTLQGSYARSTAVPTSDVDYILYCSDTRASDEIMWGDQTQRRYENFRNETEGVLREWTGAAEARRAIWTRVDGVEVHVLPALPYCSQSGDSGAWFWWGSGAPPTVTYPELITARIRQRDAAVTGRYCEVVRVFKHIREKTYWESDNLPGSNMIESLVYAVGEMPLSRDLSMRDCCIAVLEDLRKRLANEAALTITDPSGHTRLFDGIKHDPAYDEATIFVDEALAALS